MRHKNLVRLLGYCAEGNQRYFLACAHYLVTLLNCKIKRFDNVNGVYVALTRMLVYEYVDNGNLEQWLHGEVGPVSPLSWDSRVKIILGTAKGSVPCISLLRPSESCCHSICLHKFCCSVG